MLSLFSSNFLSKYGNLLKYIKNCLAKSIVVPFKRAGILKKNVVFGIYFTKQDLCILLWNAYELLGMIKQ